MELKKSQQRANICIFFGRYYIMVNMNKDDDYYDDDDYDDDDLYEEDSDEDSDLDNDEDDEEEYQ
jgi:hypothetical protein